VTGVQTCALPISPGFSELIDSVEDVLQTVVQAAVKREDEQEFARRNSQNLMFCEDASRRIKARLDKNDKLSDYLIKTSHLESLHEHNAVSIVTRGVKGGYVAGAGAPVRLDQSES